MAGILKVDDLRGNTSAGDITITSEGGSATMQLQQGVAKNWCSLNGTGTISVRDSFNTSSITDSGTGTYEVYINNNMAGDGYVMSGTNIGSNSTNYFSYITSAGLNSHVSTGHYRYIVKHNTGATNDQNRVHSTVVGDLA